MAALVLTRDTYRDKARGAWLGRQIGATLGAPVQGTTRTHAFRHYDPLPGQPAASDDLDLQLIWLHALQEYGPGLDSDDLTDEWLQHLRYPWDEFGWTTWNLQRALEAPISGSFNNWFRASTGAFSRCTIWALAAPGAPQTAVQYAWQDASLDHSSEGVWAAMFWSAVQSAAFFVSDPHRLLDIGLAMVPGNSRTARAVRIAREGVAARRSPLETRGSIVKELGHENYTDVAQNVGFVVHGWLYGGSDFGACLCNTVNCGYDTAGNAGTLGALLGILRGASGIPQDWSGPIGNYIITGWGLHDLATPRTLDELTETTLTVAERVIADSCPDVEMVDAVEEGEPATPSTELPAPVTFATETSLDEIRATLPPPDAPISQTHAEAAPAVDGGNDRMRFLEIDPVSDDEDDEAETPVTHASTPQASATASGALETAPADLAAPLSAERPASEPPSTLADPLGGAVTVVDAPPSPAAPAMAGEPPSTAHLEPGGESAVNVEEVPSVVEPPAAPEPAPPPPPAPTPAQVYDWAANDRVKPLLVKTSSFALCTTGGFEFSIDYGAGGPAVAPNVATNFTVSIRNLRSEPFIGHVNLDAPAGWQVAVPGAQANRQMLAPGGMARYGFVVRVPENAELHARNTLGLVLTPEGPGEKTRCDIAFVGGLSWWFVGPFRNDGDEGYSKRFPVEDNPRSNQDYLGRGGTRVRWERMSFKENVLPVESICSGQPGVVYGAAVLRPSVGMNARLVLHCNDGVKAWLNNQIILQRHSHEPFRPTLDRGPMLVDVVLNTGDNHLMVKLVRCLRPLEFAFAVTDRQGVPLEEVGITRWE
jgi:ADP-ribosylglycohydrolase